MNTKRRRMPTLKLVLLVTAGLASTYVALAVAFTGGSFWALALGVALFLGAWVLVFILWDRALSQAYND
jgi:hypothetical protein